MYSLSKFAEILGDLRFSFFVTQAQGVGPCEPHEVQQNQMQCPAPGLGQQPVSIQTGNERIESNWKEKEDKDKLLAGPVVIGQRVMALN